MGHGRQTALARAREYFYYRPPLSLSPLSYILHTIEKDIERHGAFPDAHAKNSLKKISPSIVSIDYPETFSPRVYAHYIYIYPCIYLQAPLYICTSRTRIHIFAHARYKLISARRTSSLRILHVDKSLSISPCARAGEQGRPAGRCVCFLVSLLTLSVRASCVSIL